MQQPRTLYFQWIIARQIFTFDFGALKTVKLPLPPLVKAGFRPASFFVFPTAVFFFPTDACDELDDDWLGP